MSILNKGAISIVVLLLIALTSCGPENPDSLTTKEEFSRYGGKFSLPITDYFAPVPLNQLQRLELAQIYSQIFIGLVKYNPKTLEVEKGLAKDWKVSEDGKTYTFILRDDAYFHDNDCFPNGKGRLVTGKDVVFSLEQLFSSATKSLVYPIFKGSILGGEAYYNGEVDRVEGITSTNNTVEITLEEPSATFLLKMATVYAGIYPEESLKTNSYLPVGAGPFVFDAKKSNSENVVLVKNEKFFEVGEQGDKLPYLDGVEFRMMKDEETRMDAFWNKELTYLQSVPVSKISEVLEDKMEGFENKPPKYKLLSEPQLSTTYLQLNTLNPILQKKKVRQALNFAIDKKKLIEKVMKNQAYDVGRYGLTPPVTRSIRNYDYKGIETVGYTHNPEKARELLAEAGYPDGKNFPMLKMQFSVGGIQYLLASELQKQFRKDLKIEIDIEGLEHKDLMKSCSEGGADIFYSKWAGDFPNPETFLILGFGAVVPDDPALPSYPNAARYKSDDYDAAFMKGSKSFTMEEAYQNFAEAEKILLEDAAFAVLWYGEDMKIIQANARNFDANPMRHLDLSKVYFKEPTKEEYLQKLGGKK